MKPQIFQLRLTPDLHEALRQAAFEQRKSMNGYIVEAIEHQLNIRKFVKDYEVNQKGE